MFIYSYEMMQKIVQITMYAYEKSLKGDHTIGLVLCWEQTPHPFSANAHLAFLQSCNTVAFLQEDKCIFVGWIFTFAHVWHTIKNPLIYLSYPTSDFTATCCSKVQYDTMRSFILL